VSALYVLVCRLLELIVLVGTIADHAWSGYRHEFGGNATRAEQTAADTDFDSPLMRLAAGGRTD
jgi:hypothetical protein